MHRFQKIISRILYDNRITNWFIKAYSLVKFIVRGALNIENLLAENFLTYETYRRRWLMTKYRIYGPVRLPLSTEIEMRLLYYKICCHCFYVKYRTEILEIQNKIFGPFHNYYLLYKWRFKRYTLFPAKYLIASVYKTISSHLRIEPPKQETKENTEQPISTIQRGNEDLIFPREVWLEIAQYDVDILPLMFVNQALLDIFAPFIYGDVHGIFVVSSLEKMWASDECFLRNGPDTEDSDIDGYEIYMRNKESRNYAYEALDISYKGAKFGCRPFNVEGDEEQIFDDTEDAGPSFPSVSYSLNRDSTIVSCYSGLNCIITQILKNPSSIMKKYLRKFSIDIVVLSDIDKFKEEFETFIEDPTSELKNHKLRCEDPNQFLVLSSGYDDNSDDRISKRYKMKRDLEVKKFVDPNIEKRFLLNSQTIKRKFKTVYHKELFGVAQLFESLFKPTVNAMDRRSFGFRNSGLSHNWNFVFWKFGFHKEQLQSVLLVDNYEISNGIETREATDFFASSLEIKDRTFLSQDTMDEFCRLVGELSRTDPTKGNPNYSFMIHGMQYSNYTELFYVDQHSGRYCYDNCYANPKIYLFTNTLPTNVVTTIPDLDSLKMMTLIFSAL